MSRYVCICILFHLTVINKLKLYAWCFQNINLFSKHGNNICLCVFPPHAKPNQPVVNQTQNNNTNCAKADMNFHVRFA